ncbi:MAG: hypothetical protein HY553_05000 [Elusimicrobia bacterium]|nr:hypothetical protein [Elusimicrobiota bacterium]
MLLAPLLALALPCLAAEPWSFELGHDGRGSRVAMSYRVRWDLSDVTAAPRRLAAAVRRPAAVLGGQAKGMLHGIKLNLYGIRLRPFREQAAQAPSGGAGPGETQTAGGRVLERLHADARRELRSFLIRSLFDRSLPAAAGAPYRQKEALFAGLVDSTRSWTDE